nr:U-box domain-containing protein 30-like [Ipomoea batatas]
MVKLLMKVSEKCTQLALSVLWAVCKLAPERCASVAVEVGLAAQLLLVIQSGCNPALKQRGGECEVYYFCNELLSDGNPGFESHVFRPPQNELMKPRLLLWLDANNANEFAGDGGLAHELLQMAAALANMLGLSSQNHWFHGSGSASSSSLPPMMKEEDDGKISSMFYEAAAARTVPPSYN